MSTWLLCMATNLLEPMRPRKPRPIGPPIKDSTIDAISSIRIEWTWDGDCLIAGWVDMATFELPAAVDLRRDRLRSWAEHLDRPGAIVVTSMGGRHFAPILRRTYLADDIAYPTVLGMDYAQRLLRTESTGIHAHIDLARFLGCESAPELTKFLEACGIAGPLARASSDRTLEGAFLRSIVTFHMSLRILVSAGRLSHAERHRAEERILEILSTASESGADMSLGLAARSNFPKSPST